MKEKLKEIKEHIKKVYLTYNRPMVIGYSGGKDSSATLQIVWDVVSELNSDQLVNDIHVISTDTLVETPYIEEYINNILEKINLTAGRLKLPIKAHKLTPIIKDTFWANLIGKGYPAPSQQFRWCTDRLKIKPVNKFVYDYVDKFGEVTLVLGARRNESSSRDQVLDKKRRDNLGLSKHPDLSAAYVYTPIEYFTNDDVWGYLLNNQKTDWGSNNRDLAAMYKNAAGGDCPMVIDTSTPSCGSSRFGCWVCTLVASDSSMENLIDSGEEWMLPLLELRDFLKETQRPENKPKYRSHKRRDGKVFFVRDGARISYGPYKFEWKKEILRMLLSAQKSINENGNATKQKLISFEELELIRTTWKREDKDWEDSVPKIYDEIFGADYEYEWIQEDSASLNNDDYMLLAKICKDEKVPVDLVAALIDTERDFQGISRRAGIINNIDKIFKENWDTEDEVLQSLKIRDDNKQNYN